MRSLVLRAFSVAFVNSAALAQDGAIGAPQPKVGDSWTFDHKVEQGASGFAQSRKVIAVERVDDDTMLIGVKPDGAQIAPTEVMVGRDWSRRRLVNGEQTVTVRPLMFPLAVGNHWAIDFVDPIRRGNQLNDHVKRTYSVTGWEQVTVPAGTFRALKIVAKGVDQSDVEVPQVAHGGVASTSAGAVGAIQTQRGGRGTLTRSTYAELYYVPSVKYWVRSIEEQYTPDGVRVSRQTDELVAFKPAA